MKIRKIGMGLLLTMAVLLFGALALAEGNTSVLAGTVRVCLTSLAELTAVDVEIDGSYSIGGDPAQGIARGTTLRVANDGGALYLDMQGKSQEMGTSFVLRRHQISGKNGVHLMQANKPKNLYEGDLEFIAQGNRVQVIVHTDLEDYLCGVLPYEIDETFLAEAMKAQAVVARTYAVRKMSERALVYDLVDTESDQVYRGTPDSNDLFQQAVEETRGVVGMINGQYMASFYTTSNGGQTESAENAWGNSTAYPYFTVRDDPYDLKNSASIAKSVTFYTNGNTSLSALTDLLRTRAAQQIGLSEKVKIIEIDDVRPHTSQYGGESRVYRKVDVSLTLRNYGPVLVTLDYFEDIEPLCGLSINTIQNETLAVARTEEGLKLTARRCGHGVGLSQRGAQQMAREGMTYEEILNFYYPGIKCTKINAGRSVLPALDGTRLPEGYVLETQPAVVELPNRMERLNLRQEANATSTVLTTVTHGTPVTLLDSDGTWCRVQVGTVSGYVRCAYIRQLSDTTKDAPVRNSRTATVQLADASQSLNLRATPIAHADVLAHLRHGQMVQVLERGEDWSYVEIGSLRGYVVNTYIQGEEQERETNESETVPMIQTETDQTAVVLAEKGVCVRFAPHAQSGVMMTLPQGTMLRVCGEIVEDTVPVTMGGMQGYVPADAVYVASNEELGLTGNTTSEDGEEIGQLSEEEKNVYLPEHTAETMARVTASTGLKIRSLPNGSATVLATMPHGTWCIVLGEAQNGFYPVQRGDLKGYASSKYLKIEHQAKPATVVTATGMPTTAPTAVPMIAPTESPIPTETPVQNTQGVAKTVGQMAVVTAESGLKLRSDANKSSDVLVMLERGTSVLVLGEAVNGFYPVRVGAFTGYASASYLRFSVQEIQITPDPTETPKASAVPAEGYRVVVESRNGLNLRERPDKNSAVQVVLPDGMVLQVIGENENGFLHVRWAEYTGYVSGGFVRPFGAQGGQ